MGAPELKAEIYVEDLIAKEYVTTHLVDKVYYKISCENGSVKREDIPRILNTTFYDIVKEEMWEIIKKHKNPKIDFKVLQNRVYSEVKRVRPEIF
jgi:hypothetical protein